MRKPPFRLGPAVAALAVVAVVLAAAGRGSASGGGLAAAADKPTAVAAGQQAQSSCPPPGAYDVTDDAAVAWSAALPGGPAPGQGFEPAASPPVAVDGLAVFGYGNVVSARRLGNGQQAWQRAYPESAASAAGQVGGVWAWHGELIVLLAPVYLGERPADMRVQALSPVTGAVRWTASLGSGDLYNDQVIASGGMLAVIAETGGSAGRGKLMAVDLDTGRLAWSRPYGKEEETDGPDAAGPVVVMAEGGAVTGFDARTGAVRWTHGGLPGGVGSVPGPGGEVLLYDLFQQTSPGQRPVPASKLFPVTALDAASGWVRWRARTAGPVTALSALNGVITVANSGPYRLSRLSASGRVLWSVPDSVSNPLSWVTTATDLVYVSSQPDVSGSSGSTRLVDRRLSTGAVRWSTRLADYSEAEIARPAGPDLTVATQPFPGGPAVLAVDQASGKVQATASLAQAAAGPLTVSGRDTLILAGTQCAVPAVAAASGSAAPGSG